MERYPKKFPDLLEDLTDPSLFRGFDDHLLGQFMFAKDMPDLNLPTLAATVCKFYGESEQYGEIKVAFEKVFKKNIDTFLSNEL